MSLQFSGRIGLILGGTCELAISLAEYMIREGLFPILTYRNEKGLNAISERLKPLGEKFATSYLDFSDRGSLRSLFKQMGSDMDYLIDFAHGDFEGLIASVNEDEVYGYFSENISFRAEIIKNAARIMLQKRRGRLIFISSSAAIKPNPGQGFYAAAKLASEALYRNLGLELGGRGITAVTLRPGYINEGRGRIFLNDRDKGAVEKVPIKRALSVAEVAETILFYLSDSARGFNATEISMDGGLTAGK